MTRPSRGPLLRRVALGAVGLGIVIATFVYFLPTIANYGDVWAVVKTLSWPWIAALLVVTIVNIVTFAPPWMVVLPGLSFLSALQLTQASTAISLVVPGGPAAGAAAAFGVLRRWGFATRDIARAVTLTSLWNQLLNLSFPIVAVFLLTISGESTATLATAAFVGVAILGVVVAGLVLVLVSDRLAQDVGDVSARFANWALGKVRRGPVGWNGGSFERFRQGAGDLLTRRWHLLTLGLAGGQPQRLRSPGRLAPRTRSHGVGSVARRRFRGVGARSHHRVDPDHAGRHRRHRVGIDGRTCRFRRE